MNLLLDYFTPAISTTYVDVDYEGLDLFRQPDKGMNFALKYVSSVYCKIPVKVYVALTLMIFINFCASFTRKVFTACSYIKIIN